MTIVDYKMSSMQGSELSNKISTINTKIGLILITAYDDIKNNNLNLEIVKKPITITKLLQIIQQYLNWLPIFFYLKTTVSLPREYV